jgi:hypothetical protein
VQTYIFLGVLQNNIIFFHAIPHLFLRSIKYIYVFFTLTEIFKRNGARLQRKETQFYCGFITAFLRPEDSSGLRLILQVEINYLISCPLV